MHTTDSYSSPTEVEDELAVTVYADNVAFIVFEWSCKDTQLHVVFGKLLKIITKGHATSRGLWQTSQNHHEGM